MDLPADRCEKGELHAARNPAPSEFCRIGVQLTIAEGASPMQEAPLGRGRV